MSNKILLMCVLVMAVVIVHSMDSVDDSTEMWSRGVSRQVQLGYVYKPIFNADGRVALPRE